MMKRLGFMLAAFSVLSACQAPSSRPDVDAGGEPSAWLRPPMIAAVTRGGGAAVVTGQADPGARVVLRGEGGAAFAAAADPQGKFVVRIAELGGDLILTPEVQNGQEAAASADRLVLLASGPSALLRAGGSTLRLDAPSGGLDAIDSDGRALLASGRGQAGRDVVIAVAGRMIRTTVNADGRWSVMLPAAARSLTIDNVEQSLPLMTGEGVSVVGGGQMIGWRTPDGALQNSWLPSLS